MPWQAHAYGSMGSTNIYWNYAMGYHFTPQVNGYVTALGGRAGLQHQNAGFAVFAKPRRQDRARRAGAGDDVIEFST